MILCAMEASQASRLVLWIYYNKVPTHPAEYMSKLYLQLEWKLKYKAVLPIRIVSRFRAVPYYIALHALSCLEIF